MSQSLTNFSQNKTHAHLVNSAPSAPWNGVQEPLGVWRGPAFFIVDVESRPKLGPQGVSRGGNHTTNSYRTTGLSFTTLSG